MTARFALIAAFLVALPAQAIAQTSQAPVVPVLRASVTVSDDIVRVGDFVSNAGEAAQIPVFRAPDPGTVGVLQVAQVIAALRNHHVIGVDVQDIREVEVARASRPIAAPEIRERVARALANRNGLGNAADIGITFDRDIPTLQLNPAQTGAMEAVSARYNQISRRFDVLFEIGGESTAPLRLRFTGIAIETVETAVLTRTVERGEVIKPTDISVERKPKSDVQGDVALARDVVGLAAKRPIRAGQLLRATDLNKPELVQRDQGVTLVLNTPGVHLTIAGKAVESGSAGDVISVMNLQSKRVVQGTVIGPGQVRVSSPTSRLTTAALPSHPTASRRNVE